MVRFCRTIFIQYYNWENSYRVYDHATANGRQLPIIKRPRKFSCCTLLEIQQISSGKKIVRRNSTVCKLKLRGKITAPTNFAEIYISVGGETCKSSNVSKIF